MKIKIECYNIGYNGKICGFVSTCDKERKNYKCPSCGKPINVNKLFNKGKYALDRL
jgi:hypothetical protein